MAVALVCQVQLRAPSAHPPSPNHASLSLPHRSPHPHVATHPHPDAVACWERLPAGPLSQDFKMFNSLKRVLASAAHAPRQRAMSAGVAAPAKASTVSKEEEAVKSWTCYDVIEWASSIISADVLSVDSLKAAKLDGESLLEMRQNQSLVDALMSNGLEPTVAHQLAGAVRKLVAPGVSPRYPLLPARRPVLPRNAHGSPCTALLAFAWLRRLVHPPCLSHDERSCVCYSTK